MGAAPLRCVLRDAQDRVLHSTELWAEAASDAAAEAEALCRRFAPPPHIYEVWCGDRLLRRALSMRDGVALPIG
jgi:hypothetical protein